MISVYSNCQYMQYWSVGSVFVSGSSIDQYIQCWSVLSVPVPCAGTRCSLFPGAPGQILNHDPQVSQPAQSCKPRGSHRDHRGHRDYYRKSAKNAKAIGCRTTAIQRDLVPTTQPCGGNPRPFAHDLKCSTPAPPERTWYTQPPMVFPDLCAIPSCDPIGTVLSKEPPPRFARSCRYNHAKAGTRTAEEPIAVPKAPTAGYRRLSATVPSCPARR